ncbi:hypothetical protein LTR87_008852 [Friedmanniomyces endolithicus]|nr:hypothetical protein LTR87_008852 [Friedmanniomyces endolithicus]
MDAACNLVIDSKVEERMGALQASLHQKIEREVQELTDAVRDSLHGELSAWKEATFKQMEDSLTSFLKESKEVKEQQTDLSRGIAEVKTQVGQIQHESAARTSEATATALNKAGQEPQDFDLLQNSMAGMQEHHRALATRLQTLEQKLQTATATVVTTDDGRQFAVTPLMEGCLNDLTRAQGYPPTGLARLAQQVLSSTSSLPQPTRPRISAAHPSLEATIDDAFHLTNLTYEREQKRQKFAPASGTASSTLRADSNPISSSSGHLAEASGRGSPETETIVVNHRKPTNPELSRAHSEHPDVPSVAHRHDLLNDSEMVRNNNPEDTGAADGPSAITALKQPHIRSSSLPATGQSDLLRLFQSRPGRVAKEDRAVRNSGLTSVEEAESTVAYGKNRRRTAMRPPRYQEQDPGPVDAASRKGRAGAKRKFPDDEFTMVEEEDAEALELRQQKMRQARDARASRRM